MTELEQWHRQCFPDRDLLITLLNLRGIAMRLYMTLQPHEGMKPPTSNAPKVIDQSWRTRITRTQPLKPALKASSMKSQERAKCEEWEQLIIDGADIAELPDFNPLLNADLLAGRGFQTRIARPAQSSVFKLVKSAIRNRLMFHPVQHPPTQLP